MSEKRGSGGDDTEEEARKGEGEQSGALVGFLGLSRFFAPAVVWLGLVFSCCKRVSVCLQAEQEVVWRWPLPGGCGWTATILPQACAVASVQARMAGTRVFHPDAARRTGG